jgi:amino acid transporter
MATIRAEGLGRPEDVAAGRGTHAGQRVASVLAGVLAGVLVAVAFSAVVGFTWWSLAILIAVSLAVGHLLRLAVTVVIVALLAIVVFSYRQVIDAYPGGGGAYAVSRDNFGPRVSLVAAAALVVDCTLTVAVSIAAGTGALT